MPDIMFTVNILSRPDSTWSHLPINTGYAENDFCDNFKVQKV